jgi:hypothetical protein
MVVDQFGYQGMIRYPIDFPALIGNRFAHPNAIDRRSISVVVGGFLFFVYGWGNGFWINPPLRFTYGLGFIHH